MKKQYQRNGRLQYPSPAVSEEIKKRETHYVIKPYTVEYDAKQHYAGDELLYIELVPYKEYGN
jgi:hypothetical protein